MHTIVLDDTHAVHGNPVLTTKPVPVCDLPKLKSQIPKPLVA